MALALAAAVTHSRRGQPCLSACAATPRSSALPTPWPRADSSTYRSSSQRHRRAREGENVEKEGAKPNAPPPPPASRTPTWGGGGRTPPPHAAPDTPPLA